MKDRVIFHVDVNSAFLSWEAVYRIRECKAAMDLRDIPSAIGGDIAKRHGIILAKSIPAKKYGVVTGESVTEALRKCPDLYLASPNFEIYHRSSEAFIGILREYTPDIEQCSIDEAFMDVSGTRRLFGEPIELAHTIRNRIREELGFTVNIGISDVKLLAKMASDFKKPDRVHSLFKSEIQEKMWKLPVDDLIYVGKSTKKKLYSMGIRTIGELAKTDLSVLKNNLKSHGELIWKFSNGIDVSPVVSESEPNKGYGNSTTVSFDVTDAATAKKILLSLSEKVAGRLRDNNVKGESISVEIKDFNFYHSSHQKTLPAATNITAEIFKAAGELFDELWDGTPIRLLGIQITKLKDKDESRQLSLFDDKNYEKLEAVDSAIDSIRERYGMDSVKRAAYIKGDIKHNPHS